MSGGSYLFSRAAWQRFAVRYDSMMISTASRKNLRDTGAPIVEVGIRARIGVAERRKILDLRTILRTLASAARLGVEK